MNSRSDVAGTRFALTIGMFNNYGLACAISLALLTPACGLGCSSKADVYSGGDRLPNSDLTAEEAMAAAHIQIAEARTWIPHPSEYEGGAYGPIPPLPYDGTTSLEVEVTPLDDSFVDEHIYEEDFGCVPGGTPEALARVTVRTSDGVLDESVIGTLSVQNDEPHVSVIITEPKGRMKEYFAGYEDPLHPFIKVEVTPRHARLEFVLERRHQDGASWDYATLL